MSDWWRSIEDELDARSVDAPDPWASFESSEPVELTDEQRRFLLALDDQPAVPHIDEHDVPPHDDSRPAPPPLNPDDFDEWSD